MAVFALALALAGCSTSSANLESSKSAARSEKVYPENYQLVYRRITDTAKRCHQTAGTAAFNVDAQLYNELGFGEITMSLVSALYPRNYYWKAKVEKAGSGSKVSIVSGNTLAQGSTLRQVSKWADGDTAC
ncbi:hypothetical protein [Neorhizobium sp. DAR64860/K0K1]|uniref:hypothetical protein n=1 Tax=Neorhizobium sp. DAR64860/K0K1 TaxID=3421955 RepID=UPI003D2BE388